jgi:tetratricopeptide (TPR) repeat protein
LAKAAAVKATQLDDSIAQPHVTLGNLYALYERNWAAGEREFLRAIELNPNSIDAHFMYGDFLISLKRNREWDTEIHKVLALDPMSSFTRTFYGWHLVYLGKCDEAIEVLNEVISQQPNSSSAHLGLWGAYYKKHMDAEAMQEAISFFEAIHDQETAEALSRGFSRADYRQGMHEGAKVLTARAAHAYVPAIRIARLYAHAGDADNALQWLNQANQNRETPMGHLGVACDWDPLRGDPRFQQLMLGMNFPH